MWHSGKVGAGVASPSAVHPRHGAGQQRAGATTAIPTLVDERTSSMLLLGLRSLDSWVEEPTPELPRVDPELGHFGQRNSDGTELLRTHRLYDQRRYEVDVLPKTSGVRVPEDAEELIYLGARLHAECAISDVWTKL
jgi:hypothetical protein